MSDQSFTTTLVERVIAGLSAPDAQEHWQQYGSRMLIIDGIDSDIRVEYVVAHRFTVKCGGESIVITNARLSKAFHAFIDIEINARNEIAAKAILEDM